MLPNVCGAKIFNEMTMLELITHLRECSVSINGYLKPALVNIALAVEKMMLPNFEKEKNSHKLIIHQIEILTFTSSCNLVNEFGDSLSDYMIFLII